MAYLFIAAFGLVLLLLLLQRLEFAERSLLLQVLKWTVVGVLILVAGYLALVGRLLHVAAIAVLLILLLKKDFHTWRR